MHRYGLKILQKPYPITLDVDRSCNQTFSFSCNTIKETRNNNQKDFPNMISVYGVPEKLLSDNGGEFANEKFYKHV